MHDIVFIITGLNSGGAERNLLYLCKELERTQKIKIVVLGSPGFYSKQFENLCCDVEYLRLNEFRFSYIFSFLLFILRARSRRMLVVTWLYHADFLSIFLKILNPKIRVIWNVRTAEFGDNYFRFSKVILWVLKICSYFVPEKILYNSQRGMASHQTFGYCRTKGSLVSNVFLPPTSCNLLGQNDENHDCLRLGFIGRYAAQKGLDILISVFNDLSIKTPNLELHIAGVDESDLEVAKINKKIIIYGKIENVDLLYNNIDVLVLPSRYGEGTPNVLLEALWFGLPCISTDIGDISTLLASGRGIVVQPNNDVELKHAIEYLFKNNNMFSKELKNERRSYVLNKYSAEQSISEYKRQAFE